jgi:Glyoxalase/Bleomycin resistance protein/Dioxygenase superfamily
MERFSFGAVDNSIIQFAYTVDDIDKGMLHYAELLHIGPWFLIGPFVPAKGLYRGAVTKMKISLAVAFAGEAMVELIEQHDAEPSVYQETLKARGAHGFSSLGHWRSRFRLDGRAVQGKRISRSLFRYFAARRARRLSRHLGQSARNA